MRRSFLAGAALLAGIVAMGCGAEDHPNDPRPPAGVNLSATINNHRVIIAPQEIGAGLATITLSNQAADDVEVKFIDQTGRRAGATNPIAAGGVGTVQINLKQGSYELMPDVSTISSGTLTVGTEHPSAQNDLLLP